MTTDIVHIARATGYDAGKVQLVKDTIAKGASDDELMLFLHLAQRTGLDPFTRQIYLIERRQNVDGQWKTTRQPQTGIDGLRLIAERSERYVPGREPTFEYDADGQLVKATAYIKKWVRGEWHEIAASAHYDEYVQRKKDGQPNQFWNDKPHIMLAKCAEALALRRTFPADMGGLYTPDEMSSTEAAPPMLPPAPPANVITGEVIEQPMSAPQLPPAQAKPPAQPERPEPFKQHNGNGNGAVKDPRQTLIAAVEQFIDCATAIGVEVSDSADLDKRSDDALRDAGRKLRKAVVEQVRDLDKELIATAGTQSVSYIPAHVDLLTMRPDDLKALGQQLIERITELATPEQQEALIEVEAAPTRLREQGEI